MRKAAILTDKTILFLLWIYRKCVSPWTPDSCRFIPTCSTYARDAVLQFGACRGGWLAFKRVVRCHPFYRGCLYDPVPSDKRRGKTDLTKNKRRSRITNE